MAIQSSWRNRGEVTIIDSVLGTNEALILHGAAMATRDGTVRWEGHLKMKADNKMTE